VQGFVSTRKNKIIDLPGINMKTHTTIAVAVTTLALLAFSGCAVTRDQETVGAYVDDTAITSSIKARFVNNKQVDASSISVETLNGTVQLSGFAKNETEKATAESIARNVKGVKAVKNQITVRP
jgi:hyperosmotically inducible periplasmic protein